ncbi:polyphosphate kinase 2 [Riemerella anatipestifer]|uniref:polyphosphate kinase 2 n=1 Tax=Riemerella anatipestifer TaxID=34085 RepID=UPI00129E1B62|nr:polyphosphate kinase 2 [Riemerella anatipestifer]MDY3319229.1 polyphosphate kinase 2 [Riemerella anatipestifer]MDY3325555.1 polyphosphate kinase 2 [Riemerella anatipestifer]MDY3354042.1 polyphosphate kinase 2 [Riemerella anatipestifer]MRM84099.1 polyphosphate kinase 2 [Riemerella anatipestifer]
MELTDTQYKKLDTKKGLYALLQSDTLNPDKALRTIKYEKRLAKLQEELIKMQNWVVENKQKVIIIFEGRDAAGKGGAIRRITEHLNPREHRVVALPKPNEVEQGQWYFQRYISQLPKAGEIVFFDRSWYNRAVVEPVNDFCTKEEYDIFMSQVNEFEKMLVNSGIYLLKLYFSISKEEQAKRFADIIENPLKKWKYSPVDAKALDLWEVYTEYKEKMFEVSDTEIAPWKVLKANKKSKARVEALEYILDKIPYESKNLEIITHEELED